MDTSDIIVNLKTYENGSGQGALRTALKCEKVALMEDVDIAITVQNADLHRISQRVDIPVIAQHMDPHDHGPYTGKDIGETLKFNGADGVLVNHSEDQIPIDDIETVVARARKTGLSSIVAVDLPEMVERVAPFRPDMIALEPPELIGGNTSVATAEPDLIKDGVERSRVPLLVGAGIKDADDVRTARELGAEGVLIASGVVKADDPVAALRNLSEGI